MVGANSLSPQAQAFLTALLNKTGNAMLQAQSSACSEGMTEEEALREIDKLMQAKWYQLSELTRLAKTLEIPLTPYAEVDETILTAEQLNHFIVAAIEYCLLNRVDLEYEIYRVKTYYQLMTDLTPPLTSKDQAMMHISLGTDVEKPIEESDDINQYINIFSGEEYDNGRKNHSKGAPE